MSIKAVLLGCENHQINRTVGDIIREKDQTGRMIRNTYGDGLVTRAVDSTTTVQAANKHSVDITYGDMRYYRDNGHGDVSAVTNGSMTDANTYNAFGSAVSTQLENPYGYQSARYDSTTGLYRMGEQDYDMETARYLTMNTKQENPYVYDNVRMLITGTVLKTISTITLCLTDNLSLQEFHLCFQKQALTMGVIQKIFLFIFSAHRSNGRYSLCGFIKNCG